MYRASRRPLFLLLFIATFLTSFSPDTSWAALAPRVRAELTESTVVTPALVEALEQQERVVARIYFLPPASPGKALSSPSREGASVSPVVVDLAQALLPGELELLHFNSLDALQGPVDARVVQILLRDPRVVGIDLDDTALPEPELPVATKASCVPSATRACVQGGRFSLQVFFSGSTAVVATSSSESAVFWFYSSTNWEVVAKVLNACAINNRFWIFGAGATSTSYSLNVVDMVTGRSAGYNGGVLCPIVDTGQAGFPGFPCS